jgi:hypothetical protein
MKKLFAITLALALGLSLILAGCSQAPAAKLGFASKTTMGMSADLADNNGVKSGKAQADTMMCAVVVDANGKVVSIKIDIVQSPITFDETGKITTDKATVFKTKRKLGDAYGMKKASGIGKEWYEQADAIQKWMIGKTADQIKAMKVKTSEKEGTVSDEPDLVTSATIGIGDFIEVAANAVANAK